MKTSNNSIFFTEGEKVLESNLVTEFSEHLEYDLVKDKTNINAKDVLKAVSLTIRDYLIRNWLRTQHRYNENNPRKIYYLSLEFLIGSLLGNTLINLGLYEECQRMLREFGYDIETVIKEESDMGLGNGGLGRLAACFLDSMSTLELPAYGYGIRYEFGIFEQVIENGYQIEKPDNWLRYGNPWEIMRPEFTCNVQFNGRVISFTDENGKSRKQWVDTENILAVPYDIPVPGYQTKTVNNLRLWQAKASDEFDLTEFNKGDYLSAVKAKSNSEIISKVLYPNDSTPSGKELRLKQQYFFVAATLHDIVSSYKKLNSGFSEFPKKVAIHLNDTHPAIAIPELMRILIDDEGIEWNNAWEITRNTFSFTNHTVLPEALEEWPTWLIGKLFPRHLELIMEINDRFKIEFDNSELKNDISFDRLSILTGEKNEIVRMSNLAIIGSHSVNGVAKLHTEILKKYIFHDFYKMSKSKFHNITNGVSQRRFLLQANPALSGLLKEYIGEKWISDLSYLREIENYVSDEEFRFKWDAVKNFNKGKLIAFIKNKYGINIFPDSIMDSQIKRFHEYKRQLLNILHIISIYLELKNNSLPSFYPRTFIFSGKSAPSYLMAKLIIKLINSVASVINQDEKVNDLIKIVFIENYSVSLAELIIPASEVSEQISTAGFEASGTGNMKFVFNGAVTIGTSDGANIEIRNEVGEENIFIFGLTAEEIITKRLNGYHPLTYYESNSKLKNVIDAINDDQFSIGERGIFKPIIDELLNRDYYFVMADFQSYYDKQRELETIYKDRNLWTIKSILNTSRSGIFSSDRAIKEYAENIWQVNLPSKNK